MLSFCPVLVLLSGVGYLQLLILMFGYMIFLTHCIFYAHVWGFFLLLHCHWHLHFHFLPTIWLILTILFFFSWHIPEFPALRWTKCNSFLTRDILDILNGSLASIRIRLLATWKKIKEKDLLIQTHVLGHICGSETYQQNLVGASLIIFRYICFRYHFENYWTTRLLPFLHLLNTIPSHLDSFYSTIYMACLTPNMYRKAFFFFFFTLPKGLET